VSGLPDERVGTPARGAKQHAWTSVKEARASWAGAMRAHEQAPPDPGFCDRLRALAEAAAAMRDAHARALQAGLAWRPVADSERARPPYELRARKRGAAAHQSSGSASTRRCSSSTRPAPATTWPTSSVPTPQWPRPPRSWPTRYRARASSETGPAGFSVAVGFLEPVGSSLRTTSGRPPTPAGEDRSSKHPRALLCV
jgi:hypothetical protein